MQYANQYFVKCYHNSRGTNLQVGMSEESRQAFTARIFSQKHLDQQDALQSEAVGAFGSVVLPKLDVVDRIFGGEQKPAVGRFEQIQGGPNEKAT